MAETDRIAQALVAALYGERVRMEEALSELSLVDLSLVALAAADLAQGADRVFDRKRDGAGRG